MPNKVFCFLHRRTAGRGPWKLLRFCEPTREAAERTANGWRQAGAEVRVLPAKIGAGEPQR